MPAALPFIAAAGEIWGATLATTALTSGLGYAAGAFTAIGALTGNKDLSRAGSILGLGAGVSGLADKLSAASSLVGPPTVDPVTGVSNVGPAANDVASTVGAQDAAATGAANSSAPAAQALDPTATSGQGVIGSNSTVTSPLSGPSSTPGLGSGGPAPDPLANVNSSSAPSGPSAPSAPGATPDPASDLNPGGTQAQTPGGPSAPSAPSPPSAPDAAPPGGPNAPGQPWSDARYAYQSGAQSGTPYAPYDGSGVNVGAQGGNWLDALANGVGKAESWAQANPNMAKVAGGLIAGGMNYAGAQSAADAAQKRQMAYQDWVRQRYSDSVRNLQIPTFKISRPGATAVQSPGLIGGQRG